MNEQGNGATPASRVFELNRPTVVSLLYLAGYFTGVTVLIGLVLAYVWKREPHEEWEGTHYSYLIRTFWLGILGSAAILLLAGLLGGGIGGIIGDGGVILAMLLFAGLAIAIIVRCVLSLANAQRHQAMPKPRSLTV